MRFGERGGRETDAVAGPALGEARQIDGGGAVATPWPRDIEPLSRAQLQALQEALNRQGFAAGTPDGVMGPATRAGLRGYQRSLGVVADGYPTLELLQKLQAP